MNENELDTTEEEWRSAVSDLIPGDPGLTIRELCEKLGTKRTATQDMVRRLVKDGKCKKGRSKRVSNGVVYYASVYQIITSKKEKSHA